MKKVLLIILTIFVVAIAPAQPKADTSRHLTFKGVPVDGTLSQFILKMKLAGFAHVGTSDGMAMLEGDFASYKNCVLAVSTLNKHDLVNKIVVIFPNRETWSALASNYFNLKDLLTEKYGQPSESVEKFQSYTPKDDGGKFSLVRHGSCEYYTTYDTDNGSIQLAIDHEDFSKCFVTLIYFDKINSESVKKQALEDL